MSEPRVTPPAGAWGATHQPLVPRAGHGVVVVVSIALAAALVASGSADGTGQIALLLLLLAVGALAVPVAVMATTWAQAGPPVRVWFAVAGFACLLVLAFAVVGIVTVAPAVLSS